MTINVVAAQSPSSLTIWICSLALVCVGCATFDPQRNVTPTMAMRYDVVELKKAKITDAGFLRGEAFLTRTGVFQYRNADGSIRNELRIDEEVFKEDSIDSLSMVPLTLDHPSVAVNIDNAKQFSIGSVGDARKSGNMIKASILVTDRAAIDAIRSGQSQVSCGYSCDVELAKGVHKGMAYDGIQRNIVYNHVAAVKQGRAGEAVAIRLDSQDAICIDSNRVDDAQEKENQMTVKIRLDGVDYEVSEQASQAFAKVCQEKDAEIVKAKSELEKSTARGDALEDEVKKTKEATSPEKFREAVSARVALANTASQVLGSEVKTDSLSDEEIKKAVIVKLSPSANLEGKSADYVSARFDQAIEMFDAKSQDESKAKESTAAVRSAALNTDAKEKNAHEKMIERNRNLWRAA